MTEASDDIKIGQYNEYDIINIDKWNDDDDGKKMMTIDLLVTKEFEENLRQIIEDNNLNITIEKISA
jgi:hypothetical protein